MGYKKFRPQRNNANKHTERGLALLEKSVQRDGWMGAITVAADGETFDGSARLETVANVMGESEPIVIDVDGTRPVIVRRTDIATADDPRAKRLAVAANSIAAIDWNPDGELLNVLAEQDDAIKQLLKNDDAAVRAMFEAENAPNEEADAEPQIDRAAELQEKWKTERGQLWAIGAHRLLCGDSTVREDVERVMGGEKATIIFTDPPYGVSIGEKNRMLNSFQPSGRNLTDIESDDINADDLGEMLLACFKLAREQCADNASVFVCSPQGGSLGLMMMMMRDAGLTVRHVLNWIKNAPTFSMGRLDYDYQHEPILFTWIKTHKRNKAGNFQTSTWHVDKPRSSKEHPTMKPVELPENAISNHTDAGDICYEPFAGSGTTLVACQNLSRQCRAIEISPAYCAVILERMASAFPDIDIHLITDAT